MQTRQASRGLDTMPKPRPDPGTRCSYFSTRFLPARLIRKLFRGPVRISHGGATNADWRSQTYGSATCCEELGIAAPHENCFGTTQDAAAVGADPRAARRECPTCRGRDGLRAVP